MPAATTGSSADVGSSMTSRSGVPIRAMAMTKRCCIPRLHPQGRLRRSPPSMRRASNSMDRRTGSGGRPNACSASRQ
ncbi:conserved hypothetical protein [Roseobacter denitrificans OCh 114]|uniref:Uncharacterized protein n=1 Tax=Roseobacter denitrificans (strain ATCC 33942 / OCh 114) TaxID=375451 RepID=Q168X2_ROSDO|nr:conserved hypothetical protein [Roseobacter denitrificans OCh 114]